MAANKLEIFGPQFIPNAAGNLIAPAAAGAGGVGYTPTADRIVLRHIRVLNVTGGAVTYTLYKGATGGSAAGTQIAGGGGSVPANSHVDHYGAWVLEGTNGFLTGIAGAVSSLVITAEGEVGKV